MVVKGVVTEIDVLVVEIGGKVTAEEVTVNELDLDKDTETELAFDANHEGVTVDEAVTLVGAVTVVGAVAVGEAVAGII